MGKERNIGRKGRVYSLPDPNGQESPMFPSPNEYPINPLTGKRRCLWCGKDISKHRRKPFCGNSCRPYYRVWESEESKRVEEKIANIGKKHDRRCRVCGKPCYPNYFFCDKHMPVESDYQLYSVTFR